MNRTFFSGEEDRFGSSIYTYKAHAYNTFIIIILLQNRYIYSITSSSAILKKSNALKNAFRNALKPGSLPKNMLSCAI